MDRKLQKKTFPSQTLNPLLQCSGIEVPGEHAITQLPPEQDEPQLTVGGTFLPKLMSALKLSSEQGIMTFFLM